jgi:hypothetical protein
VFGVKWVTHQSERESIKIEDVGQRDLDEVVSACMKKLPSQRLRNGHIAADGFVIFDASGKEVRRWFASARGAPVP